MEQLKKFKKTLTGQMLITAAAVGLALLLLGYESGAGGFVLGSLFSLANFLIMSRQMAGRLGLSRKRATVQSLTGLVFRLLLMAIPLLAAVRLPAIDVIWTAAGLFNLQFSMLVYGLFARRPGAAEGR